MTKYYLKDNYRSNFLLAIIDKKFNGVIDKQITITKYMIDNHKWGVNTTRKYLKRLCDSNCLTKKQVDTHNKTLSFYYQYTINKGE